MIDYAEKERSKQIGMVETRRQVKERVEEEREEMEAVEKEKAAPSELSLEFGESQKKSEENVVQDSMQEDLGDSEQSVVLWITLLTRVKNSRSWLWWITVKMLVREMSWLTYPSEREEFAQKTSVDPTLQICREIAENDKGE